MLDKVIIEAFLKTCSSYERTMSQFRACKPGGEMSESNLVFTFLKSFSQLAPDAICAAELPFSLKEGLPWSSHLDGFIYFEETIYLIEAKRDYPAKIFFEKICNDLERIKLDRVAFCLKKMLNREGVYSMPINNVKQVKGILLADTWSALNQRIWATGKWDSVDLNWFRSLDRAGRKLPFSVKGSSSNYSLLIAQTQNLEKSLSIISNTEQHQLSEDLF
ncbi:hypothetical protein [Flocculibacter collagenilyticus]|uniref:hypothetical protein n=1 Tax=Flocculibacter collagenilyticus TaxID=2744479 RepID=UPI0018F7CE68|nr:hypothetical protein [Flocculibacter collagenilyticus]